MRARPERRAGGVRHGGRAARRALLAALVGAAALIGAAAAPARAQEWTARDCRPITAIELSPTVHRPGRLYLELTVRRISGLHIIAEETEVTFQLAPDIRASADAVADGDRIRVFGFVTPDRTGTTHFFYVKRLESANPSEENAAAELERLRAAGDAQGLVRLGDRVASVGAAGAPRDPLARDAYTAAVEIEQQRLDPKDRAAVLRLAQLYATRLDERARALALLTSLLEPGGAVPYDIDQVLREIRAVRYGPERRWVLFEEMKSAEGFVVHRGQWVKPERAAFLDAIAERQQSEGATLREPALEAIFGDAARTRQLLVGMVKREVRIAKGFPVAFDRVRVGLKTYDAWRYADGTALYFEEDVLFRK